jgi:dihydroorotate dehydrogenase (fumarate)
MSVDLRTRYLGLELRSPLVASPSPLTFELDTVRRLEDAGVGAIVLPSLFEEEILHEEIELNRSLEQGDEQFAEASSYFPSIESFAGAGDRYLARLEQIKAQATVPVIASLNADTAGGWVRYGRLIQEAGADALELNIYHLAADGVRTAADMEEVDLGLIAAVRASITIPLMVKVSPFYSALANFAGRAVERGADGLVIFNRFYEPDLDLETLDVVNRLELSRPSELRLVLRWIAILRSRLGPGVALAATSGVHAASDAAKALVVGADVAMMTSALLVHGPEHVRTVEADLRAWMADHEYESVDQLRGSFSQAAVSDPAAYERANYLKTLRSFATPREFAAS